MTSTHEHDPRPTIDAVNALDRDGFVALLGGLFEGSPWIADRTWPSRPFAGRAALHEALCATMDAAPRAEQVALIQAHPDLVGKAALAGTLTPRSAHEQSSAGLDHLTSAEVALFARLNEAYRARFGFPFVICARLNKKEAIVNGLRSRVANTRDEEIGAALGEIAKISLLRLEDIVEPDKRNE